jgi:hypothetical protein
MVLESKYTPQGFSLGNHQEMANVWTKTEKILGILGEIWDCDVGFHNKTGEIKWGRRQVGPN